MKHPNSDLRQQRFELQAGILRAVAHPTRLAILDLLRSGEVCVCDIASAIGAERSNVSRHLALMSGAGVLQTRREGLKVFYSLRTPCLLDLVGCATRAVEHDIEARNRALSRA